LKLRCRAAADNVAPTGLIGGKYQEELTVTRPVLLSMPVALLCAAMFCGCAAHFPPNDPKLQVVQTDFDVAPKEMVQKIQQVLSTPPLSIGAESVEHGSILSGWQAFPGEWHVLRQWQERTRYRITVSPDFDEPLKRCMVQVRDFTEQRASDGMKWESSEPLPRPQRAVDLLEQIKKAVSNPANSPAPATAPNNTPTPIPAPAGTD
jgi:hypothetical protein